MLTQESFNINCAWYVSRLLPRVLWFQGCSFELEWFAHQSSRDLTVECYCAVDPQHSPGSPGPQPEPQAQADTATALHIRHFAGIYVSFLDYHRLATNAAIVTGQVSLLARMSN